MTTATSPTTTLTPLLAPPPPEIPDEAAYQRYRARVRALYGHRDLTPDEYAELAFRDLARIAGDLATRHEHDALARVNYVWRRLSDDWDAYVAAHPAHP